MAMGLKPPLRLGSKAKRILTRHLADHLADGEDGHEHLQDFIIHDSIMTHLEAVIGGGGGALEGEASLL